MDNPRNLPAVRQTAALALPTAGEIDSMLKMAELLVASRLVPDHLRTPQQAFYAMQKGRELGIPPTHALSNIIVIQGKPTANANLMAALIYRDHGDDALRIVETTAEQCVVEYKRRAWSRPQRHTFTIEDARRAGLADGKNPTWKLYPQAMLRARCISAVATMAFQDTVAGMYTPEELGAGVTLDGEGDVVSISIPDDEPRRYDAATGERTEPAPRPPARANGHGGRQQAQQFAVAASAVATAERAPEPVRVVTGGYRPSPLHCQAFRGGHPCGGVLAAAGGKTADDILGAARAKGLPEDVTLCNGCLTVWREAGFRLTRIEAAAPVEAEFTEVEPAGDPDVETLF